jgi:hypothetical protein
MCKEEHTSTNFILIPPWRSTIMSTKVSAARKARYASYAGNSTAAKNKVIKLARHMKKHPNDAQSLAQKPGARAGISHEKRSPAEAAMNRYISHQASFGHLKVTKKAA